MADPTTQPNGGLAQLAAFVANQERKPLILPIEAGDAAKAAALLVPTGYTAQPLKPLLDAFRLRPELRAGLTTLLDLDSFDSWANRHKDGGSVIFADDNPTSPSLTAVIDHDEAGAEEPEKRARFGRHRGVYTFPLSREWKEWTAASKQGMGAADFAAFFERRIGDVMPPPFSTDGEGNETFNSQDPEIRKLFMVLEKKFANPADIVKLTRGIQVNSDARATQRIDRDTGEVTIEYSEANDGGNADRVKPPNTFLIAIPVLHNGQPILIAVHLRYRPAGGKITWFVELHQPERVFEEVFRQALAKVEEDTKLKPLRGIAPPAR